jgi:micrococcal nuclease
MYEYKAKVLRVIDGDTIDFMVDMGFSVFRKIRIRLANVDTPEIYGVKKESAEYEEGMKASGITKGWLDSTNNEVIIKTHKDQTGKYGRYIAEVYATTGPHEKTAIQELLIESGYGSIQ